MPDLAIQPGSVWLAVSSGKAEGNEQNNQIDSAVLACR
jgi:hypothetical protein